MEKDQLIDLREKFFRVSNNIFSLDLDSYDIALYTAICRYINNETKMAYPSIQKLADMCKMSKPKAVSVIKNLIEKGLIYKVTGNYTTSNKYYLLSLPSKPDKVVNDVNQGSKPRLPGVVNDVNPIKTNIKKLNIKTNKGVKKNNNNYKIDLPINFNTESFLNTWEEWEIYRKEKKCKLTKTTVKKQIKFLSAYPVETAIEIINTSIRNGWQGLFEIKNNSKNNDKIDRILNKYKGQ